jgi:hypothetical protein
MPISWLTLISQQQENTMFTINKTASTRKEKEVPKKQPQVTELSFEAMETISGGWVQQFMF